MTEDNSRSAHIMDRERMQRAMRRICHEILEQHAGAKNVVLVGIHTRGVPLAHALAETAHSIEAVTIPVGELDIGLYRDDLSRRPTPELARTQVPVDLSKQTVVLVDDVLYTGRTIRAALDAISDLGRPERVELAVLVDRGHRQLPIRPDYIGMNVPSSPNQRVTVKLDDIDGEMGVWISDPEHTSGKNAGGSSGPDSSQTEAGEVAVRSEE